METLLILAAVAVAVLALASAWVLTARNDRPPLRTRQEEEMIGDDEEGLIAAMTPAAPSPIDRAAPILEIATIEAALRDGRFLEDPADEARRHDGRTIEGQVIEGRTIEGSTVEDEAKARAWKASDTAPETGGSKAPRAAPTERKNR